MKARLVGLLTSNPVTAPLASRSICVPVPTTALLSVLITSTPVLESAPSTTASSTQAPITSVLLSLPTRA
jgi:hypothetical protein